MSFDKRAEEVRLALVILAAGAVKRFGAIKQLANYRDKALLQHAIDSCSELPQFPCYVVLGANQQQIIERVGFSDCHTLINSEWQEGIGSSIRYATEQCMDQFDALLFLAGDQIKVGQGQLEALVNAWREQPRQIACADYEDQLGIPAIFPKAFYPDLLALKGDVGGKKILLRNSGSLSRVPISEASVDIDLPSDLVGISSQVSAD